MICTPSRPRPPLNAPPDPAPRACGPPPLPPFPLQVEAGLAILKKEACDFVISFGGGSPHDCAKAIAIVASNGGAIRDYEGVNKMKGPMMTLVAINTTAGTASEMTRFAIITDEKRHVKVRARRGAGGRCGGLRRPRLGALGLFWRPRDPQRASSSPSSSLPPRPLDGHHRRALHAHPGGGRPHAHARHAPGERAFPLARSVREGIMRGQLAK